MIHQTQPENSTPWYAAWFGREYAEVYAHRDVEEAVRQVDFAEYVLRPPGGARVLDLCCGAGRHSVELVRRGYHVTGVDLSADLLDLAKDAAQEADADIRFVQCDMRTPVAQGAFDVVVSFFTSFGYFDSDEENAKVFQTIRESLAPGGVWLMDYLNRDHVIRNLVPRDSMTHGDMHITQQRWFDALRGRVEKTIALRRANGELNIYRESVRAYTFREMERMIHEAGLRIDAVFGDIDRSPFETGSPRMIITGSMA